MNRFTAILAAAILAVGAVAGECERKQEYLDGGFAVSFTNTISATLYCSTLTNGIYTVWADNVDVDPSRLDPFTLSNACCYAYTNGTLAGYLGGDTVLVARVAVTVRVDESETDNAVWETDYGQCYMTFPMSYGRRLVTPATERTQTWVTNETAVLSFQWRGEKWTAKSVRELGRTTRHYFKREKWEEVKGGE